MTPQHAYSREWWIRKVQEGMEAEFVPAAPKPDNRRAYGPRQETYCFYEGGVKFCGRCSDCRYDAS